MQSKDTNQPLPTNINATWAKCRKRRGCIAISDIMDYEIKKLINDALTEAYIRINNHDINKTIEGLIKQLRELINNTNFNDNNTNLQNIITTNIEELISMIKDVENKWNHAYKNDVNSTLKESLAGKNRVFVVKGRYGSLFLKIRGKLTSIEIEIKRNKSHSVVTQIYLRGLSTRTLIIPNMLNLSDNEFYDLRLGFRAGDGTIYEGRPAMKTRQLWQLVLWSLLYPGEVEVSIKSLGFTKKSVNITWFIYSKTHKETIKNKDIAFQELEKRISSRNMLTLILSDGSIDLKKKNIKMSAGLSNYEKLSKALTPLSNELKIKYQISVKDTGAGIIFWNSNAVILARHIVNNLPNKLKKILNILEEKLNLDKWRKLKALANVSIGRMHGSSQVEIYGIKFNVLLTEKTIQLRTWCGKKCNINEIIAILNKHNINYKLRDTEKLPEIYIPWSEIKEHDDLLNEVIKWLKQTVNNNEKSHRIRELANKWLNKIGIE